jgi:hypothetical protein
MTDAQKISDNSDPAPEEDKLDIAYTADQIMLHAADMSEHEIFSRDRFRLYSKPTKESNQ